LLERPHGPADTNKNFVRQRTFNLEIIMSDPTESARREMIAQINAVPGSREALEAEHGQVWDTSQLTEEFQALGFMAPLIIVRRRSDGVKGSLMFQHNPRFYFSFQPE
jgi:hypothetical protein